MAFFKIVLFEVMAVLFYLPGIGGVDREIFVVKKFSFSLILLDPCIEISMILATININ